MENEKVVFIRGTGRCGTKNLVRHLGAHPQLAHVPVNEVLPENLIDWSRDRLQADDPRVSDEVIAASCRAYFSAYGRSLAGSTGLLVQKSTLNAHHLPTLLDFWPESRIIYLVRHPIGVVEAMVNADIHLFRGEYGYRARVADSLLRWYNEVATYRRSSAFNHPRVLQVRFEDLIQDTRRVVTGICAFVGIDDIELSPYDGPGRYDKPFVLNESERRWVIESTADLLWSLGYDARPDAAVPGSVASLTGLYPDRRLSVQPSALDGAELVRLALTEAARAGHRKVGLYGAGYFARLVCPRLTDLPVDVPAIFDDNASLACRRIGALPILRSEAALDMHIDAVIPATFVHQHKMIQRWNRLIGSAVPILPLWHEGTPSESVTPVELQCL